MTYAVFYGMCSSRGYNSKIQIKSRICIRKLKRPKFLHISTCQLSDTCLLFFFTGMVSCDTETYTHSRLRQHHFKDVPAKELKGLTDVGVIREYTEDSAQISFIALPLHRHTRPLIARDRYT